MGSFVCLDTNIYVRFISQGMPGCEQEQWDALVSRVNDKTITLLVPEIISLELEKQWLIIPELMKTKFLACRKALEKNVRHELDHSELREFPDTLLAAYDKLSAEKSAAMETRHQQVQRLIRSEQIQSIAITAEIMHRACIRSLRGGTADPSRRSDADCAIIESLVTYFSEHPDDSTQLLLCSENKSDFGLKLDNETIILHPRIASALPTNELFLDLQSLTEFLREQKPIEPPNPKRVEEAVEHAQDKRVNERVEDIEWYSRVYEASAAERAIMSGLLRPTSIHESAGARISAAELGREAAFIRQSAVERAIMSDLLRPTSIHESAVIAKATADATARPVDATRQSAAETAASKTTGSDDAKR
jgi:hypothetical protein